MPSLDELVRTIFHELRMEGAQEKLFLLVSYLSELRVLRGKIEFFLDFNCV
jgi:hypothetical protein